MLRDSLARRRGVHHRLLFSRRCSRSDAGGITGAYIGGCSSASVGSPTGDVYIANTYASGNLDDAKAGGIVGCIVPDFSGTVSVEYSVYNDPSVKKLVGDG